ncbi:patatin-like phospholipase family protein [Hymenobacter bucti]|uniref:Patatin-like phospholipase family protein n=1 Tax=Hymenobacter bucti TaxID=1844114 RepID=A0ABW4QXZ3_9BACT
MEPAPILTTPTPSPLASEVGFDIGLVMAGAVSAGAYTAGVINFLFEALDEWNESPWATLKEGGTGCPWSVRLKTMAGASAGGMCAALTALAALKGDAKTFYDAWVKKIDIEQLLDASDLMPTQRLLNLSSILNCDTLDRIARDAIKLPETPRWPRWLGVGQEFNFYLTLTNLNGLTYSVPQIGASSQRFTDHADRIHFRLRPRAITGAPPSPELCELPANDATYPGWAILREAALATGAFPIALASRTLTFDNAYFDKRLWYTGAQRPLFVERAALPTLKAGEMAKYRFVDGGVTDNKPLELTRRALFEAGQTSLPRGDTHARQAVLMVDPFPSEDKDGAYQEIEAKLGSLVAHLYQALRNQSRFKVDELLNALDLNVSSRFAIAPNRRDAQDRPITPALACGTLGAFGGFLFEGFRQHDYDLGRRNCQYFLQQWFVLSEKNPLFRHWNDTQCQEFRIKKSLAQLHHEQETLDKRIHEGAAAEEIRALQAVVADPYRRNENQEYLLPILPLRPHSKLTRPISNPDWQAARLLPKRE